MFHHCVIVERAIFVAEQRRESYLKFLEENLEVLIYLKQRNTILGC